MRTAQEGEAWRSCIEDSLRDHSAARNTSLSSHHKSYVIASSWSVPYAPCSSRASLCGRELTLLPVAGLSLDHLSLDHLPTACLPIPLHSLTRLKHPPRIYQTLMLREHSVSEPPVEAKPRQGSRVDLPTLASHVPICTLTLLKATPLDLSCVFVAQTELRSHSVPKDQQATHGVRQRSASPRSARVRPTSSRVPVTLLPSPRGAVRASGSLRGASCNV